MTLAPDHQYPAKWGELLWRNPCRSRRRTGTEKASPCMIGRNDQG